MRQRRDRQPQPERGIARYQEQMATPQLPAFADPARTGVGASGWIGSTKPLGVFSPASNTRAMRARSSGSASLESAGIDIDRQGRFLLQPVRGIFERRHDVSGIEAEPLRGAFHEAVWRLRSPPCAGSRSSRSGRHSSRSARRPCANRGRTPSAAGFRPDTICPARNAAARRAQSALQLADQFVGQRLLGRADGGDIPFRRFQIVDGDEGRLAAHRQPHVIRS